jgi:hypothetical protein
MSIHIPKDIKQKTYKEAEMPFVIVNIDVDPALDNGDAEKT